MKDFLIKKKKSGMSTVCKTAKKKVAIIATKWITLFQHFGFYLGCYTGAL